MGVTGKEAYDASRDVYSYARQAGFYGMLMAALRGADSENYERIRAVFPDVVAELEARYNAPGGVLDAVEETRIERITRPPVDVITQPWLEERLAAAEDVCALYGWSPARNDDTDREKATHELWRTWLGKVGSADREAFPHLTDERIAELAARRDATRRMTLRRFGLEEM